MNGSGAGGGGKDCERAHFPRHAGHFGGEGRELPHHGVHDLADPQELAPQRPVLVLQVHGLRQVALGHRADHPGHLRSRVDHVGDQVVHRIHAGGPGTGRRRQLGPVGDLALPADHLAQPLELLGHAVVELDHVVERLGDLAVDPGQRARQAHREVAAPEGAQRPQ